MREQGWFVSGEDTSAERVKTALEREIVDAEGLDPDAEITVLAVPVLAVPALAERVLAETAGFVTDVGSTKASVSSAVSHPRFVGGHPMAGSGTRGTGRGLGGHVPGRGVGPDADPVDLDETFAGVARIVSDLGAEVVALESARHDELVMVVSHVPHLKVMATLMRLASAR
ncbi:MAG: prephenate dehydrogenase/arogenate dehydrogenase family protein [Ilumatobacteraceae bacterium]